MANGETLREVRDMLTAEIEIPQKVTNRMILSLLAEVYVAQKEAAEKEDVRHEKLDRDIKIVKDKSIIIWVEANKPISAVISALILIVFLVGQSIAVPWIAKSLGVPLP